MSKGKSNTPTYLRRLLLLTLVFAFTAATYGATEPSDGIVHTATDRPTEAVDFSFTERNGAETTLFAEMAKLPAEASVSLLLFDPDCDHCKELIASLTADEAFNDGLRSGSNAIIAVFPVAEPLESTDPNLIAYQQLCAQLPPTWIVGIDNGSIFATDAYIWDQLPLLLQFAPSSQPSHYSQISH